MHPIIKVPVHSFNYRKFKHKNYLGLVPNANPEQKFMIHNTTQAVWGQMGQMIYKNKAGDPKKKSFSDTKIGISISWHSPFEAARLLAGPVALE